MGKPTNQQSAAQPPAAEHEAAPDEVLMEKDGVRTEVRNGESVQVMEAAGWKLVK